MGRGAWRAARKDAARGRSGAGHRLCLRRQRRRSARSDARAGRGVRRHGQGHGVRRSHHRFGGNRARIGRDGRRGRLRLRRCAGIGRPGGGRERRADGDVRRRGRRLCAGRVGDPELRETVPFAGAIRLGPAGQDDEPDLHRRHRRGAGGGHPGFRQALGARHRGGDRGDLQRRGAIPADGEPL